MSEDKLKIPFQEIKDATNNFKNCIGRGGYGRVYKGELTIHGKLTTVAVKRLNEHLGQGLKEFLTEIDLLSGQHHPNLISLVGYCDEGKEKIIIYEYAERGSFDKYIKRTTTPALTWVERLKICAGAARGLDHLHNHVGEHQSIIHRDIKSANILISKKWVAKISDLGLSRLSLAGLDRSAVISHACGTPGYCEPEYRTSGVVTKKSDVYSFGMVLFEALCGRLCNVQEDDGFLLSDKLAKDYYKLNKLDDIVDPGLREQMSGDSMTNFSSIAYRCLHDDREQRPSMDVVKKELEEILKNQVEYELEKKKKLKSHVVPQKPESYWESKLPRDWKLMMMMLDISFPSKTSKKKLYFLLQNGILFDGGNKVFWIKDNGTKCLLISATRFLPMDHPTYPRWVSHFYLRFSRVAEYHYKERHDIRCQIKASMLSPNTMYAASLVFKYREQPNKDLERLKLITIKWKMEELSVCSTHASELIANNWYKIKMWHFINDGPHADFDIVIEELSYCEDPMESELLIQGIEFHPIEMMQHEKNEEDDDEYWEKKLPNDYQRLIQRSDKPLQLHQGRPWLSAVRVMAQGIKRGINNYLAQGSKELRTSPALHYTNKKDLYLRLCEGFLGDNGELWFSLCKSIGGICSMLPATSIIHDDYNYKRLDRLSHPESRFGEVKKLQEAIWYTFECRLQSHMFSPQCIYACYLVFKFEDDHIQPDNTRIFKAWYNLDDVFGDTFFAHFNSSSINIPTIKPKNAYRSHDLSNIISTERIRMPKHNIERLVDSTMEERGDGWMEVMLCKPLHQLQDHKSLRLTLSKSNGGSFSGIIVEGVEFRPLGFM